MTNKDARIALVAFAFLHTSSVFLIQIFVKYLVFDMHHGIE